jgi:hypothetical protein
MTVLLADGEDNDLEKTAFGLVDWLRIASDSREAKVVDRLFFARVTCRDGTAQRRVRTPRADAEQRVRRRHGIKPGQHGACERRTACAEVARCEAGSARRVRA